MVEKLAKLIQFLINAFFYLGVAFLFFAIASFMFYSSLYSISGRPNEYILNLTKECFILSLFFFFMIPLTFVLLKIVFFVAGKVGTKHVEKPRILNVEYLRSYVSELNKSFPEAKFVLDEEIIGGEKFYVVTYLNKEIKTKEFPQYYDLERQKVYFSKDAILGDKPLKD